MRICTCRCTHRVSRRQHLETRVLIKVTPLTSSERLCITVFAGTLSGHVKARGNQLRRLEPHSTLPSPKADCRAADQRCTHFRLAFDHPQTGTSVTFTECVSRRKLQEVSNLEQSRRPLGTYCRAETLIMPAHHEPPAARSTGNLICVDDICYFWTLTPPDSDPSLFTRKVTVPTVAICILRETHRC